MSPQNSAERAAAIAKLKLEYSLTHHEKLIAQFVSLSKVLSILDRYLQSSLLVEAKNIDKVEEAIYRSEFVSNIKQINTTLNVFFQSALACFFLELPAADLTRTNEAVVLDLVTQDTGIIMGGDILDQIDIFLENPQQKYATSADAAAAKPLENLQESWPYYYFLNLVIGSLNQERVVSYQTLSENSPTYREPVIVRNPSLYTQTSLWWLNFHPEDRYNSVTYLRTRILDLIGDSQKAIKFHNPMQMVRTGHFVAAGNNHLTKLLQTIR